MKKPADNKSPDDAAKIPCSLNSGNTSRKLTGDTAMKGFRLIFCSAGSSTSEMTTEPLKDSTNCERLNAKSARSVSSSWDTSVSISKRKLSVAPLFRDQRVSSTEV